MAEITRILEAVDSGDPAAADELLPLVYDELRRLAASRLSAEKPGLTLQPTSLVHETYLRLIDGQQSQGWNGRGHFFAAAAHAMRRILIESARRKKRDRHGGGLRREELREHPLPEGTPFEEILALDDALKRLELEDPGAAEVVQLHFFAGMSIEQVAESLGVARATAYRQWAYARAWLRNVMGEVEVTG